MLLLSPRLSPDDVAALLEHVNAETDDAQVIAHAAGLTVHSSVLDIAYKGGGNNAGVSLSGSSSAALGSLAGESTSIDDDGGGGGSSGGSMAPVVMDLRWEATRVVQARHRYKTPYAGPSQPSTSSSPQPGGTATLIT